MKSQGIQINKIKLAGYPLVFFLTALLLSTGVMAASGDLDATFDGDGMAFTDLSGGNDDIARDLAIQSDGKIIVVGNSDNGSNIDFGIVRYNTDGSLDTSFDGDGKVNTDFGGYDDLGYSVAIQPDGKIVVGGQSGSYSDYDLVMARYNTDGSLDTSFDGDGMVIATFGSSDHCFGAVATQSDGKIILAGSYGTINSNRVVAVARYNSDGSPDTTFSGDGLVTANLSGSDDACRKLAIQSDGKIVVSGESGSPSAYDFAVARFNDDGSLDTTFSGDGMVTTAVGSAADYGRAMALQSDGKIIVAGQVSLPGGNDFGVVRYNTDGSLDTSFDGDGMVQTSIGSNDIPYGVAIQTDGKIVVAGTLWSTVARYNIDGSLDTSFAGDGTVFTFGFNTHSGEMQGVAIQADGKIVVAGFSSDGQHDFTVIRYESTLPDADGDGEPDVTDGCPNDPLKITPGLCGCGTPDMDTDVDGTPDCRDGCPQDPFKISPGICGCGLTDTDSDGDGAPDCMDDCPDDPLKILPGVCGCGTADTDSDGDGTPDCIDDPVAQPPVADAGPDQIVGSASIVTLDGSGSFDPNGSIVNYLWAQAGGPSLILTGVNSSSIQFVTPIAQAEDVLLTFLLTVTDNEGLSSSASVNVTVSAPEEEPCEAPPQAISPEDGGVGLSLTPVLVIDKNIDPLTCGTIHKARWQISEHADFNGLTYNRNVFDGDLFFHQVPPGVLLPETTYYWRAQIHCSSGCTSEYSAPSNFTTGKAGNDANGNGIPDDQELPGDTDLDGDGQPDSHDNHFKGVSTIKGNTSVAIATSGNITCLQSLDNMGQAILEGMPENMPWGLINFRIEMVNPGETVQVTIYFDEKAPKNAIYYKFDPIDGWIDYSEHATFAPNMKSVTIEIQDGGFGDLDGVANAVIVDPGGIGTSDAEPGGSGGGNSCFLHSILGTP